MTKKTRCSDGNTGRLFIVGKIEVFQEINPELVWTPHSKKVDSVPVTLSFQISFQDIQPRLPINIFSSCIPPFSVSLFTSTPFILLLSSSFCIVSISAPDLNSMSKKERKKIALFRIKIYLNVKFKFLKKVQVSSFVTIFWPINRVSHFICFN